MTLLSSHRSPLLTHRPEAFVWLFSLPRNGAVGRGATHPASVPRQVEERSESLLSRDALVLYDNVGDDCEISVEGLFGLPCPNGAVKHLPPFDSRQRQA